MKVTVYGYADGPTFRADRVDVAYSPYSPYYGANGNPAYGYGYGGYPYGYGYSPYGYGGYPYGYGYAPYGYGYGGYPFVGLGFGWGWGWGWPGYGGFYPGFYNGGNTFIFHRPGAPGPGPHGPVSAPPGGHPPVTGGTVHGRPPL
jgi:hypothetical protein